MARTTPDASHAAVEAGLVGLALRSPDALAAAIAAGVDPLDFATPRWRTAWATITELWETGSSVDTAMVAAHLEQSGRRQLALAGGVEGLEQSAADAPAPSEAPSYIRTVLDTAGRRRVIAAGAEIAAGDGDPDIAATVLAAAIDRRRGDAVVTVQDALGELLDDLERRHEAATTGQPVGVTTGLPDLDKLLGGGLRPGQLMVIGARPRTGKSAMALRMALEASRAGHPALYVSAEMSALELLRRALSQAARIDHDRLRTGELDTSDWERVRVGTAALAERRFAIMDRSEASIASIRAAVSRRDLGAQILFVDFLQLLAPDTGRTREEEVARIVRGLKHLAKDAAMPVVALSQLSRRVEDRADKRPSLADLRESGEIEQSADIVALLYRDELYNPDTSAAGLMEIHIAKQREGAQGIVSAAFIGDWVAVLPCATVARTPATT